jgi:2-haloalkanoic acid dehalogenase type II
MTGHYDIVTFDCYGTLIDWEGGIGAAFIEAAAKDGVTLERSAVLQAYEEIEPVVEAETYRSYRDVLGETALRIAKRFGWRLTPERAIFLAESLPSWKPFADTNPALERLASWGVKFGILSNVDDDLLAGTLRQFTVTFDLLVTAQQVGSYKPAPGHFLEARRRIDASGKTNWLHAAQSYFHDVVPASRFGIPVAWINRKGEEPSGDARPDRELGSLAELADWLG